MLEPILKLILGDANDKALKEMEPIVKRINEYEPQMQKLTDDEFPKYTLALQERMQAWENREAMLPEVFALVREAAYRVRGERHFDVQLMGGVALYRGNVAEMKTGEGKTLTSTLAAYFHGLEGKGVHIVTVNDYLARRDAQDMGSVFSFLGLSTGVIYHGMNHEDRKSAYACDIVYGTNNEFGFDYLRDNMQKRMEDKVQGGRYFAIVDEIDSILIDEARTPLVISAPSDVSTGQYKEYTRLAAMLKEGEHYTVDEESKTALLTDSGISFLENKLGVENLYAQAGLSQVQHIESALKAHAVMVKDKDYVVKDGQVIIVDEFTGRLTPGRRFGEGLHQAIEAKEGVEIQKESKTLATITFQNYFRMYEVLSGMSGSAATEAGEFLHIYKLDTVVVPTNRPMIRKDMSDRIYKNAQTRYNAVIEDIKDCYHRGQPVLCGTTSIDKSEILSSLLTKANIPHTVLNAKNHEKEAEIIADAGQKAAVTVATNMAGRGTDIKPSNEALDAGGLHVIGSERHESRRIDNQLRGRSGRQGDPGSSRFYVSLDDELMRLFGMNRISGLMNQLPENQPIENSVITRSIESAQKKVESRNFSIRKHLVQYDDIMNKHREIFYTRRDAELSELRNYEEVHATVHDYTHSLFANYTLDHDQINADDLAYPLSRLLGVTVSKDTLAQNKASELEDTYKKQVLGELSNRYKDLDRERFSLLYRETVLHVMDTLWVEHLDKMKDIREDVSFASFGQKDPLLEYKDRAYRAFREFLERIDAEICEFLLRIDATEIDKLKSVYETEQKTNEAAIEGQIGADDTMYQNTPHEQKKGSHPNPKPETYVRSDDKVGRNDACPCGSGKKYKKCCGA